jgi:hypothetical protein
LQQAAMRHSPVAEAEAVSLQLRESKATMGEHQLQRLEVSATTAIETPSLQLEGKRMSMSFASPMRLNWQRKRDWTQR